MGMFDPKKRKLVTAIIAVILVLAMVVPAVLSLLLQGKEKMRLGKAAMEALQAEISGLLTPGNELVVAGAIALYGTAQIAREKHEILREHFSEGFLREAENLRTLYGTADEINVKEEDLHQLAVDAFNDVCTGGNPRPTSVEDIETLYRKAF